MDPALNDKLKNKIPSKKHEILISLQNNLPKYIRLFIDDSDLKDWNEASINQRANEIAELCYRKIFLISDTQPKITEQQLKKF